MRDFRIHRNGEYVQLAFTGRRGKTEAISLGRRADWSEGDLERLPVLMAGRFPDGTDSVVDTVAGKVARVLGVERLDPPAMMKGYFPAAWYERRVPGIGIWLRQNAHRGTLHRKVVAGRGFYSLSSVLSLKPDWRERLHL